jgi:anti-sigma factor RsiW
MFLTCTAVRRSLPAFYDRELPVQDMIAVGAHVTDCPPCASELHDLKRVGEALRLAAAPAPADDWTGLQYGVISRMRAEAHESWTAIAGRMFDDLHLLWIGLAATAATFLCGAVALSALHFASPDRDDSLRSMITVISAPAGSDLNPMTTDRFLTAPSVPNQGPIEAMLAQPVYSHDDLVLAFSAVVTREGRLSRVSVLNNEERHPKEVNALLDVFARGRLEPGRVGASAVAVNLVWLLAHTTVKAKAPRTT